MTACGPPNLPVRPLGWLGQFRIPACDALLYVDKLRAVLSFDAADERDFDRTTRGDGHGLSFWDALRWVTADRIGGRWLLSEEFRDRCTLGGVTFVDPFKGENERLLADILPSL